MIKLSVNETKWSILLARTRALILFIFDLNIWFRARKVTGTFEKRAPGLSFLGITFIGYLFCFVGRNRGQEGHGKTGRNKGYEAGMGSRWTRTSCKGRKSVTCWEIFVSIQTQCRWKKVMPFKNVLGTLEHMSLRYVLCQSISAVG